MILPPWLVRIEVQIETYHNRFAFFVSESWCSVPMWLPSEPSKGKGRLSRAKSYGQTAVRSGFSDNIRKASTDPRP
jgi:hypothetical protein